MGRSVFTSFLKSEFSEENMNFWVACEEYKKMAPSKLASRAQQIYQQYVEADAPKEVIWMSNNECPEWLCSPYYKGIKRMVTLSMSKGLNMNLINATAHSTLMELIFKVDS